MLVVDVLDARLLSEACVAQPCGESLLFAVVPLGVRKEADEIYRSQVLLLRPLQPAPQRFRHAV